MNPKTIKNIANLTVGVILLLENPILSNANSLENKCIINGKVTSEKIEKTQSLYNGKLANGYTTNIYITGLNSKNENISGTYTAKLPKQKLLNKAPEFIINFFFSFIDKGFDYNISCKKFERALDVGYLKKEDKKN